MKNMSIDNVSDPKNIISVVLMPDKQIFKDFFELSKSIKNSEFYLDSGHYPHITIAQFKASSAELLEFNRQAKELKSTPTKVKTCGLNYVSDSDNNIVWVEVLIQKSMALQKLQAQVLELPFARSHEFKDWGTGDNYRPHITLGVIKGAENIEQAAALSATHKDLSKSFKVTLETGNNGEYYSFVKPYHTV